MHSLFPTFSHLYIEEEAREYALTADICARFPKAQQVPITQYRALFNQPRQDWRAQKESQKLIIAVKHGERIHRATDVLPQHAGAPLYYASPVINCIYDCHYCFLQAMYRSANIVAFVNESDFYTDARRVAAEKGSIALSVSYDCDLLGSERIIPWASRWIEFSRQEGGIEIEIRTKSSNYSLIEKLKPHRNVILSWSLASDSAWRGYERLTASPRARIGAAERALADGWRVRFCFDPVLPLRGWRDEYGALIDELTQRIPADKIEDVSVGVFRVGDEHFKNFRSRNPSLKLLQAPLTMTNQIRSLDRDLDGDISTQMREMLEKRFSTDQIVVW